MKTTQVKGEDLRVGMVYLIFGAQYQIDRIIDDGRRYVVKSHWVGGWNPNFFNDDFESGLRKDLNWTVTA